MLFVYDEKTFEFRGSTERDDLSNTTEVNPFDETGLTVTGNYFDPEKQVWYDKPQPVDTTQQTISVLAKQTVQLTNQNKMLQQELATLAEQVVQNKRGN